MTADQKQIEQTIKSVEGLTDNFVRHTGGAIDQANEALDYDIYAFEGLIKLRVASVEATLISAVATISESAAYHSLKAYWQASPGLFALLIAIWKVIKTIWELVQFFLQIVSIIQSLKLDDLLAAHWDAFRKARDKFRELVSKLSDAIGWGTDGLLHLIHAAQGFTDVIGGFFGKEWAWMDMQWMSTSGNVLEQVNAVAYKLRDDPGEILEIIFQGELSKSKKISQDLGGKLIQGVKIGIDRGVAAFEGLTSVAKELSAIQEGMPEVIRKNIPAEIWAGLEGFSETVEKQILPRLYTAERQLTMLYSMYSIGTGKIGDLANQLAHPGQVLLGVDDLPDYAKETELWLIDDVAGRNFNQGVDTDRLSLQADLNKFDIIDNAVKAPIPEPAFMTIESPQRAALHGIVAEPKETWFIDGYGDRH